MIAQKHQKTAQYEKSRFGETVAVVVPKADVGIEQCVEVTHNNVNSKHIANKAKAIALVDALDTFVANNFAHLFTFTAKVHKISQTYSRCSQHIAGREKKNDRIGGFVIKTSSNVNTSAINRFNILIC